MKSEILQPIVALAAWTMVMWLWMYATRIPAMGKVKELDTTNMVGGTGAKLDGVLPEKVQWIAHNYNHLHEAPTVFYAVALTLAVAGAGDGPNAHSGALEPRDGAFSRLRAVKSDAGLSCVSGCYGSLLWLTVEGCCQFHMG